MCIRDSAIGAAYEYAEVEDILEAARSKGEAPFIFVLDEIEDPHNLGAIIRTANLAGADVYKRQIVNSSDGKSGRSGLNVMLRLIGLVKPLAGYMAVAILMGLAGHLCASFITICLLLSTLPIFMPHFLMLFFQPLFK